MKKFIVGTKGLLAAITIVGIVFGLAVCSEARYKETIFGITVSYSKDGAVAYYDSNDDTLTIAIVEDLGSLKVTVNPDAYLWWGSYVDIYILADNAYFKALQIKGSALCVPFVVGQVGYVSQFKLSNGFVGRADNYPTLGLGRVSGYLPLKIMLQNAVALEQLLGWQYVSGSAATSDEDRLLEKQAVIRKFMNGTQGAEE